MSNAAFTALCDRLAQIKAPDLTRDGKERIGFEELVNDLDDVLGQAKRVEALARQPANEVEHAMRQALMVHINAGVVAHNMALLEAMVTRLRAGCDAMAKEAKAALVQAMTATKATAVETDTHRATPTEGKFSVHITDEKKLPVDVLKPVTVPDLELIGARLLTGTDVPGAKRVQGANGVRILAKKPKG